MLEKEIDNDRADSRTATSCGTARRNAPRAVDPDTHTTYVLIPEELYTRVKALLDEEEANQLLRDMYPHVMEVFGRAGWDDPAMDIYNDLDPRRQS
jgi:hypothetical protein